MKNRPLCTPFVLLTLFVLITAGCLGSARKTELTIKKSSEGFWDVQASNVDLETFVLAWAEKEGVVIDEISRKSINHSVNAYLKDVFFDEGIRVVLETKGFVYFTRDGQHKVLTNAEYDSLPPVTKSYEILSRDFAYASGMILEEMKNKELTGSIDHEAKCLIFTGTWDEHDQIAELIEYWGDAEPLPDYPEVQWPENIPPQFRDIGQKESVNISGRILVSEISEVKHVNAKSLANKIYDWVDLDPAESVIPLRKTNALIFQTEESKMPLLKDIVDFLDDPTWFTSEVQHDKISETLSHDTENP